MPARTASRSRSTAFRFRNRPSLASGATRRGTELADVHRDLRAPAASDGASPRYPELPAGDVTELGEVDDGRAGECLRVRPKSTWERSGTCRLRKLPESRKLHENSSSQRSRTLCISPPAIRRHRIGLDKVYLAHPVDRPIHGQDHTR
jgi:hypothetical protein